jgi:pyruvate dehydrogenase E2 component (dihydrolipoamide acetyltransferase)
MRSIGCSNSSQAPSKGQARGDRLDQNGLTMAYEFRLPDLGEGLTEGEIARWLVSEGQEVDEDDPLVEIQTDKATVEVPSPAAGKVARILVQEGEVVPVGTVIVVIGEDAVEAEQAPALESPSDKLSQGVEKARAPAGKVQATPLVRRIAEELGVDLATVVATGPGGRVTEADVRARAVPAGSATGEGRREPLRGIRRRIVENLTRAQAIPAVTFIEECDFTGVDLHRIVPLTLKAVAASLPGFPELNARLEGDEIVYLDRYDLGVAVQTDEGLIVPVVRGCDSSSVDELADEVERLADAARDGTLKPDEVRGSTFTVTSAGKLGGLVVTPLINHPEVAILGIHRIGPRPVVLEGEIVVRQIGNVSVTFDHRVVDGARAAAFAIAVIRELEQSGSASAA